MDEVETGVEVEHKHNNMLFSESNLRCTNSVNCKTNLHMSWAISASIGSLPSMVFFH